MGDEVTQADGRWPSDYGQQIRAYTVWMNARLKAKHAKVEYLPHDIQNGIILCKLAEVLSGEDLHYHLSVTTRFQVCHCLNSS